MGKNLKYQFKNAIDSAFREGQDKHSLKHQEGIGKGKIYSYADRRGLIDVSANFSNHMREYFPEVKEVREIQTEHIQSFLNTKAENCTNKTLEQYRAKLHKLETLVEKRYNIDVDYTRGIIMPTSAEQTEKLRDVSMTHQDYGKLLEKIRHSEGYSKTAIEIGARFGARVDEITNIQKRDIDLEKETLTLHGKGGKVREIEIEKETDYEFLKEVKQNLKEENERAVPLREDSINAYLKRHLRGIKDLDNDYDQAKSGMHSIRKMAAQDHYDDLRNQGKSMHEAWGDTSEWLGHGRDREELFNVYIKNQH